MARAEQLLRNSGYETGSVVLLTDGVDSAAFNAANSLVRSGYRLSVIGVGTKTGAPVKLEGGEFLKNRLGEFVVAPVDQDRLAELAFAGGGTLSLITSEGEDSVQPQTRFTATRLDAVDSRQASTVNWKDPRSVVFGSVNSVSCTHVPKGLATGSCMDCHGCATRVQRFRLD